MFKTALLTATVLAAGAAHADPQLGASTLPNARAGSVGDTLTAFAVMANSGDTAGTSCAPAVSGFPGTFGFRAVDSSNQTFTAAQDVPVDIPAGGTQNFILSFTASEPLDEAEIDLDFVCSNALPAARIDGVNTVLLTARTGPGPDILPVMITPSGDGVMRIAALNRAQAAAVAAANIGDGTDIDVIVSADMGDLLGEPLTLGVCETGSDGSCIDEAGNPAQTPPPPGQTSVNATIGNDASTFSVFAYADQGAGVRFNPDLSRVHLRFHTREAPPVAPEELASVALARTPELAGTELSSASSAATAPGRPPIVGETLPSGIFEAVFETGDARGEGLLLFGPDGVVAGGFGLSQRIAPFDDVALAFFGTAVPGSEAGRIRADNARLHDLEDGGAETYTLRGPFAPASHVEGVFDPADTENPRILFRGQFDSLVAREVPLTDLTGPYQLIANGTPAGYATLTSGSVDGSFASGGSMSANCLIDGDFSYADAQFQTNLLSAAMTIASSGEGPACNAIGNLAGLGFEADWPSDRRGEVTDNIVTAFLETLADDGAATVQFRPILDTGFRVRRVTTGLSQALFVTGLPGSPARILVARKTGQVHIVNALTGAVDPDLFLDVSANISTEGEGGLLGLALAPDFDTSGVFYVNVTNADGDTEIRRYATEGDDPDQADPASMDVILTYAQPQANHNGGWLGFGPDNMLYIASGDGGGSGDPFENGQNPNTLLGAILRIDPSSDDFPGDSQRDYAIPAGNPYASGGGAPEVWATGLRNPFRAGFDPATGDLYIGDVGQGAVEEVDIIRRGEAGLNFGWPVREGTQPHEGGADSDAFTGPVLDYPHGSGPYQGNSITGGYVYRGELAALNGHYVFGDFVNGNVWSIPVEYLDPDSPVPAPGLIQRDQDFTPDAGSIDNVSSFGTDQSGGLYIVDYDGEIFRIEPEA
ncbi:PQQ-dependent sugar dehydrogenase [Hyphobacterium sp. SN044]|uniref:PQQ-dependent sugar dehydrogenase n=1 Tax=Hyphobacterium sp. SN044 TaxID=2912575 RepID=UPI001F30426A|nr:PQQ-dependent sugar dehydrogenase [Hyphobacterium sp. SN044]MCF8880536.1 PQQ-dependent sugar dehydrogenase [Hyphobacterium sp. SN044]